MIVRQRAGVLLMLLFLPINGPLWRMLMESTGNPIPIGELQFLGVSVLLFVTGAVMMIAPNVRFASDSVE